MDAIFALCNHFGKTISEFRVSQQDVPPFWFAITLSHGPRLRHADTRCFDLFQTSSELLPGTSECDQKLILGPLLDASPGATVGSDADRLPDFEMRKRSVRETCRQRLTEISEKTSLIHAVCGLNGIGHRHLSFSQQVQLTAEILDTIDDSSADVPVLVSFEYPWAERLASSVGGIHPLQIADSLLRQGGPIGFLGLDINLDYWPCGSLTRDPLQWIDLIDVWSQLGLPLVLCMRIPQRVNAGLGDGNIDSNGGRRSESKEVQESRNSVRCNLSDEQRLELLDTILPMMIARPGVHGMIWRQWQDNDDKRFPGGGIADVNGHAKVIATRIQHTASVILKRTC